MRIALITLISIFSLTALIAQESSSVKRISFNKGEVVDIIVSTQFPNSSELVLRYKETAFPVAFKYSYQLQPSFEIGDLILGNHKPQYLIFGKWENLKMREDFLDNILSEVPDFHDQRKAIFDGFQLTYFELTEDIDLLIDTDKYNVVTSFWQGDKELLEKFSNVWIKKVVKSGGVNLIHFEDGTSPLGYSYNPDILFVTQWESRNHFNEFLVSNPLPSYMELEDVHQFSISK